ncbi:MAG: IS3 family transposase, partial [Persicimonas sp.]
MCKMLGVGRQSYYDWRDREPSKRQQENEELLEEIEQIHDESRQTYGSPRIHRTLKAQGYTVGRNRVARIMRENDIRAVQKRT